MREIKLRAWDKVKSEMLFDFFVHSYEQELYWDAAVLYDDMSYAEASRFDLMQYTGLLDKNDKEIYEGDVVKGRMGQLRQVCWYESEARYMLEYPNGNCQVMQYMTEWEVIGNIWEHPHLLEDDNDS